MKFMISKITLIRSLYFSRIFRNIFISAITVHLVLIPQAIEKFQLVMFGKCTLSMSLSFKHLSSVKAFDIKIIKVQYILALIHNFIKNYVKMYLFGNMTYFLFCVLVKLKVVWKVNETFFYFVRQSFSILFSENLCCWCTLVSR